MEEFRVTPSVRRTKSKKRSMLPIVLGSVVPPVAIVGCWLFIQSLPPQQKSKIAAAIGKQAETLLGASKQPEAQPVPSQAQTQPSRQQPANPPISSQPPAKSSPDSPQSEPDQEQAETSTPATEEKPSKPADDPLLANVKRIPPVRLDLNRKKDTAQKAVLDLPAIDPDDWESLRLDLRVEGIESRQTEGLSGLIPSRPCVFRFLTGRYPIDIEVKLGRVDGKTLLLIRSFVLSEDDLPEKRTLVSVQSISESLEKALARHSKSLGTEGDLRTRLARIVDEIAVVERDLEVVHKEASILISQGQTSPEFEKRYGGIVDVHSRKEQSLKLEKTRIEAALPRIEEQTALLERDVTRHNRIKTDLTAIQGKAVLMFTAYLRTDGQEKAIAVTAVPEEEAPEQGKPDPNH
jgi:hypothetical protein